MKEKIAAVSPSGKSSSEGDLLDLLNNYSQKAKILQCLSRRKGAACDTDNRCGLEPYKCVLLNYSNNETVGRVEELFGWAKEIQQKADKIIKEQNGDRKDI